MHVTDDSKHDFLISRPVLFCLNRNPAVWDSQEAKHCQELRDKLNHEFDTMPPERNSVKLAMTIGEARHLVKVLVTATNEHKLYVLRHYTPSLRRQIVIAQQSQDGTSDEFDRAANLNDQAKALVRRLSLQGAGLIRSRVQAMPSNWRPDVIPYLSAKHTQHRIDFSPTELLPKASRNGAISFALRAVVDNQGQPMREVVTAFGTPLGKSNNWQYHAAVRLCEMLALCAEGYLKRVTGTPASFKGNAPTEGSKMLLELLIRKLVTDTIPKNVKPAK
ncbi:hypothetical protein [Ferrimonas marina]|nr:hypothetical protein [Ferrimonas marina]